MNKVIEVKSLVKNYKTKQNKNLIKNLFKPEFKIMEAVKSIDFEIMRGESVAFLGPNGAGKTTTIKMMTGLIYPSKGKVKVLGEKPHERHRDFLKRIGLVMGNKMALDWDLTPNQSFHLIKNIYNLDNDTTNARIDMLAQLLSVEELRIKYRYLDIRSERMAKNITLRHNVIRFFREYL